MSYAMTQSAHNPDHVLRRVSELKNDGAAESHLRRRIRAIMDGGAEGIQAVMAWDQGRHTSVEDIKRDYGVDLSTVNLLASGVERLAQRVGDLPTLRPAEAHERDLREVFSKRRNIVADWDSYQQLETLYPQIARWLPGYTHVLLTIRQGYYAYSDERTPYPMVELRDSFDLYPGFGIEPDDIVVCRVVPLRVLKAQYPDQGWDDPRAKKLLEEASNSRRTSFGGIGSRGMSRWEGEQTGVEVAEYRDCHGTSLVVPDSRMHLAFTSNPIFPECDFTVMRRYSYNLNVSQYHHVIGLVAKMARLGILGDIAAEDGVFRETNISGEVESGVYEFGRGSVNLLAEGTRVEKPTGDTAQQVWMAMDRAERQLRIGGAYDVTSDGISPNSFATQAGMQELQSGTERNVTEYQKIIRLGTERLDTRRLMWAQAMWPDTECKIYHFTTKKNKTYTPEKDIAGDYRTRRRAAIGGIYGTPTMIASGLQLLGAKVIDTESIQDAVPGIGDGESILQNIRSQTAEAALMARLASSPPGQPIAADDVSTVLIKIMRDPANQDDILEEALTPPEPEPMPAGVPPGMAPGGPPPGPWDMLAEAQGQRTQTNLSRVMSTGEADLGTQTVQTMGAPA